MCLIKMILTRVWLNSQTLFLWIILTESLFLGIIRKNNVFVEGIMEEVVIVRAKRSPIGSFGGILKSVSAVELGTSIAQSLLESANLEPFQVDEVIVGNVLATGNGQNIARQISIKAGIPETSSAFTVNKVCGSGLKAILLGSQSIMLGENDVVIALGTENMSQAPYVLQDERWGKKMGNSVVIDTILSDGLTDAFSGEHMGVTAENIAEKYQLTRQEQDEFALNSQKKVKHALETNRFKEELIDITITNPRNKEMDIVSLDEYPRPSITIDKLGRLKPAFKIGGTVTAGNASGINDGAAGVMLMSYKKAKELDMEILGHIEAFASAGVDPNYMGLGPVPSIKKVIDKSGLSLTDIDLFELNEAFAAQSIAVIKELDLDEDKVNVNGGAIALGHPIGASGAKVVVSLLHEMQKRKDTYGIASLCIGGGQGISILLKRG